MKKNKPLKKNEILLRHAKGYRLVSAGVNSVNAHGERVSFLAFRKHRDPRTVILYHSYDGENWGGNHYYF